MPPTRAARKREGKEPKPPEPGAPASALMSLWSMNERGIRELAARGIAIRLAPGRYALSESTTRYILHLRELASSHKSASGLDMVEENAMLRKEQRLLAAAKRAAVEGRLISIPELEAVWGTLVANVKNLFMSLPARAKEGVTGFTPQMGQELKEVCRKALSEIALKEMPLPRRGADADED